MASRRRARRLARLRLCVSGATQRADERCFARAERYRTLRSSARCLRRRPGPRVRHIKWASTVANRVRAVAPQTGRSPRRRPPPRGRSAGSSPARRPPANAA